jgi:HEAT repeats
MRLIDAIAVCVFAASCGSPKEQSAGGSAGSAPSKPAGSAEGSAAAVPAPPPPPSKPTSVLEQVQQAAPTDAHAMPSGLTVPGVELFAVSQGKASDDSEANLVGVVGGVGGKLLDGTELMRAVVAAKPPAHRLAEVALRVAQQDAEILDKATTTEQRKAKVRPPRVAGRALVFWVSTQGIPRLLEKATLDLESGGLTLSVPASSHGAAVTSAINALTDANITIDPRALQLLAASCGEPKVQTALLRVMGNHPRAETRAAIIDSVHKCGTSAVGPLVDVLEHDRSAMVRPHAATALGKIGDGRARPALAKAARGEDANVAWAAKTALKKIP